MDDFVKMVEATLKDDRDRFFNFLSLVKRMREAQNNSPYKYLTYCNNIEELRRLESEVDEYLKKMEDD